MTDADDGFDVDLPGDAITVTELNNDINRVIERARSNELAFDFIIGDVSNDGEANGTRYFQLVNDDAAIQCLAFSGTQQSLPAFEEGDRIAVKGRLGYYEERGECSLYVDDVILVGESHYHRQIEELRAKLEDEGLFDDDRKQPLPKYPSGIGLVTSSDSDAEKDALNAIHSRHPDTDIHIHDSRVQGIAALEDLCNAITYLDAYEPVDIIVVTRGGGSEQDLHSFNTEGVARTIASSETPVVTAIGHENDHPIVDDVADARAMTPTEIGSVVVPSKEALEETVSTQHTKLRRQYRGLVAGAVNQKRTRLETVYQQSVETTVNGLSSRLNAAYTNTCETELKSLENDLETAYTVYEQQKQHEEETEELQQQTQIYKIAIAILLVLLAAAIAIWLLT